MRHVHAGPASAIAALLSSLLVGATASAAPQNAQTVEVGVLRQIAPRPLITYIGGYAPFITSSIAINGVERTLVAIDLYGIMQAAGLQWLESVQIFDGGGNQYNSSPGADIDFMSITGLAAGTITHLAYAGSNPTHLAETAEQLAARVAALDAVSGDQDWSHAHFVSLGMAGTLTATFGIPDGGGSGGGGSGGGSGPGSTFGGGTPGGGGTMPLVQIAPGMTLLLSEAGLGEWYGIRLVGYATIPGPGPLALLGLSAAGLLGRRRRRR
jgi:hypothetical protein